MWHSVIAEPVSADTVYYQDHKTLCCCWHFSVFAETFWYLLRHFSICWDISVYAEKLWASLSVWFTLEPLNNISYSEYRYFWALSYSYSVFAINSWHKKIAILGSILVKNLLKSSFKVTTVFDLDETKCLGYPCKVATNCRQVAAETDITITGNYIVYTIHLV